LHTPHRKCGFDNIRTTIGQGADDDNSGRCARERIEETVTVSTLEDFGALRQQFDHRPTAPGIRI
jgi:hypothetical protein